MRCPRCNNAMLEADVYRHDKWMVYYWCECGYSEYQDKK